MDEYKYYKYKYKYIKTKIELAGIGKQKYIGGTGRGDQTTAAAITKGSVGTIPKGKHGAPIPISDWMNRNNIEKMKFPFSDEFLNNIDGDKFKNFTIKPPNDDKLPQNDAYKTFECISYNWIPLFKQIMEIIGMQKQQSFAKLGLWCLHNKQETSSKVVINDYNVCTDTHTRDLVKKFYSLEPGTKPPVEPCREIDSQEVRTCFTSLEEKDIANISDELSKCATSKEHPFLNTWNMFIKNAERNIMIINVDIFYPEFFSIQSGHAAIIIINKINKTAEYFDPHATHEWALTANECGYDNVEKELQTFLNKLPGEQMYTAKKPDPMCVAVQIESGDEVCVVWTLLIGILIILNPTLTISDITKKIFNLDAFTTIHIFIYWVFSMNLFTVQTKCVKPIKVKKVKTNK